MQIQLCIYAFPVSSCLLCLLFIVLAQRQTRRESMLRRRGRRRTEQTHGTTSAGRRTMRRRPKTSCGERPTLHLRAMEKLYLYDRTSAFRDVVAVVATAAELLLMLEQVLALLLLLFMHLPELLLQSSVVATQQNRLLSVFIGIPIPASAITVQNSELLLLLFRNNVSVCFSIFFSLFSL